MGGLLPGPIRPAYRRARAGKGASGPVAERARQARGRASGCAAALGFAIAVAVSVSVARRIVE
ncbi:MAG: hypothetical protein AAGE90_04250 [Pseudomonadota bacterium]